MERYRAGILGATGMVGQRLVTMLEDHPWFRLTGLAASDRSTGRAYRDAARWRLPGPLPPAVGEMPVVACRPDALADCDVVFSGLDATTAREVEPQFARAGFAVVSNASAHRQQDDVPLIIPEINADHLALLGRQREATGGGYIVTNPNCSITGLALVAAPLARAFGIRRIVVATLQAVSGAGVEGPTMLDMLDNVLPFIPGEEDKMELELTKLLGSVEGGRLSRASVTVSAHCHRVATLDGHLESASFELERSATPEAVAATLREFRGDVADLGLPSAPEPPIEVREEPDRPQPRLDRDSGNGMRAVVGRVRPCPVLGVKLVLLSHNTLRGAAGAAVLNAELLAARRLLPRRSGA